jgi:hypothetical protein
MIPIRDISSLTNARVALQEMESNLTTLKNSNAFQRFNVNVDRFLTKYGSNIKMNQQAVRTPEEARSVIPSLVTDLLDRMRSLRTQLKYISNGINDYNSLQLPTAVLGSVVANASNLLSSRVQVLSALDETARLAYLRDTVLELLAARGTLNRYSEMVTSNYTLNGAAVPFSDAEHPAVPAFIECKAGPYVLINSADLTHLSSALHVITNETQPILFEGTVIGSNVSLAPTFTRISGSFLADGVQTGDMVHVTDISTDVRRVLSVTALAVTCEGPALGVVGSCNIQIFKQPRTIYLPPSSYPRIDGAVTEPFIISAAFNDTLAFSVSSGPTITVPLTIGTNSAQVVAADITAVLTPSGFKGETFFLPVLFDGPVSVSGNTLTIPYTLTNVQVGNSVEVYRGVNAGAVRTVTSVGSTSMIVSGPPLLTSSEDFVQVGSVRGVRVVPVDVQATINANTTIAIKTDNPVTSAASFTLGMYGEQLATGAPTRASFIANYLSQNSAEIRASTGFTPLVTGLMARTLSTDVRKLQLFGESTRADITSGTSITINVAHHAAIGYTVVVRDGINKDAVGVVMSLTPASLTILFSSPVVADTNVGVDITPPLSLARGTIIRISSGINEGDYEVASVETIPTDVTLNTALTQTMVDVTPVQQTCVVGAEFLRIHSRDTSTATRMFLFDPTLTFSTSQMTSPVTGRTPYFQVPARLAIKSDDVVDIFVTGSVTPDTTTTVQSYSGTLLRLREALPVNVSYALTNNPGTPPSMQVHGSIRYNFTEHKSRIDTLLSASPLSDVDAYATQLYATANPLLFNVNPTDTACAAAENHINLLYKYLGADIAISLGNDPDNTLERVIGDYVVPPVPEVLNLVNAFKEHGADRALNLLLSCRFSDFFGIDQEGSTYGGALQKAIREVAIEDLPVSKEQRKVGNSLKASITDTNFEFDGSDLSTDLIPDPI